MAKYTTVSLPVPLYEKVKMRIKDTGFGSVSNYVTYVLRQVISEKGEGEEPWTSKDERKIKERLKGLGYID